MNSQMVRRLVSILLESPVYLTLSPRERHRLITDFIDLYSYAADETGGRRRAEVLAEAREDGAEAGRP